jgi:hypothetical protein
LGEGRERERKGKRKLFFLVVFGCRKEKKEGRIIIFLSVCKRKGNEKYMLLLLYSNVYFIRVKFKYSSLD